ncbi:hypothetical protein K490DRAFT_76006 [Saccharata proteae CBS 121410]|uniref:Uncharacterized protein n=1 Tax=Saccharata proteae CBS 121410 TaxID=1314787 RepID=A0A9P4LUJ3_9PEZI|nr:hypothetical protein K490DRAFT_76006 [Saccharata proteae CBS 121410]
MRSSSASLGRQLRTPVLSLCVLMALTSTAATTASSTTTDTAASTGSTATSTDGTATSTTSASSAAATTTAATSVYHLSDLPTLAGAGIPTITIPNLSSAPFMQKSNYPEGTVFICVGALLGFFGACILAWRGLVALSLRRSVKRAAHAQHLADTKPTHRSPGGNGHNVYSALYAGSNMSLDQLAKTAGPKSPLEKTRHLAASSASTLFFSPTAVAGASITATNRSSSHLPSGYYAPGSGNRARSMAFPSPPESPGLPPQSRDGHGFEHKPSSPLYSQHQRPQTAGSRGGLDSPGFMRGGFGSGSAGGSAGVYGGGGGHGHSTSTLNLNVAPQGRAPSAYLEDLFESHGGGAGTGTGAGERL